MLLQRSPSSVPSNHIGQFSTAYNSSSRESNASFWPSLVCTYTHTNIFAYTLLKIQLKTKRLTKGSNSLGRHKWSRGNPPRPEKNREANVSSNEEPLGLGGQGQGSVNPMLGLWSCEASCQRRGWTPGREKSLPSDSQPPAGASYRLTQKVTGGSCEEEEQDTKWSGDQGMGGGNQSIIKATDTPAILDLSTCSNTSSLSPLGDLRLREVAHTHAFIIGPMRKPFLF